MSETRLSVVDRLTDPSNFPASHRERFSDAENQRSIIQEQHDRERASPPKSSIAPSSSPSPPRKSTIADSDAPSSNVVDRLTDPTQFPAGHRQRFAEHEDERTKAKDRASSATKKQASSSSVTEKARVITIFKNGTRTHEGTNIVLNSAVRNMKQLLAKCPNVDTGPVRRLIDRDLETVITTLDKLRDGHQYLACGPEPVNQKELPLHFQVRAKNKLVEVDFERVRRDFPDLKEKEVLKAQKEFSDFDDDQSGKIDRDEIKEILAVTGYKATDDEIKASIIEFDTDKSGTLDFYEFLLIVRAVKKGNLKHSPIARITTKICVIQ